MNRPDEIHILQDAFWAGEINEAEFYQRASEAGMKPADIAAFLQEVREEDGVL